MRNQEAEFIRGARRGNRNPEVFLGVDKCKARLASAQSIPDVTATALAFTVEDFDYNTLHSNTTNTSRIVVKNAGVYAIYGYAVFAASAVGIRQWRIRINGTDAEISTINAAATGSHHNGVFGVFNLSAFYYVELVVYQSSGGALDVNPGNLAVIRLP